MGGVFGGYGLYLVKGKPVFVYNLLNLKGTRWKGGAGSADLMGSARVGFWPSQKCDNRREETLVRGNRRC